MSTSPLPPVDLGELDFLTVAEVADVLRVSKMTVYRMCHSGELVAARVGRSFRVPSGSVRAYLGMEAAPRKAG